MRKLTILSLVFILTLTSCQKEINFDLGTPGGGSPGGGSGSGYYIKFKKDGVAKNYTSMPMAQIRDLTASAGMITMNFIGNLNAGISLEGINFGANFFSGTAPAVGTYSEGNPSLTYIVAGVHTENDPTFVYSAGIVSPSVKPLVINILTLTSSEVTGTFEGAFYKTFIPSGTIGGPVLLTNGEFRLKLQ